MTEHDTSSTVSRKRGRKPAKIVELAPRTSPVPAPAPQEVAPPQLTTRELYELRLAEAEFQAAKHLAETARFKRLYILALLDPKGRVAVVDQEREAALSSITEAKKKYEQIKATAFARLGLQASSVVGFDADTGVIQFPDSARG